MARFPAMSEISPALCSYMGARLDPVPWDGADLRIVGNTDNTRVDMIFSVGGRIWAIESLDPPGFETAPYRVVQYLGQRADAICAAWLAYHRSNLWC